MKLFWYHFSGLTVAVAAVDWNVELERRLMELLKVDTAATTEEVKFPDK
jgi:hypothetical protein